MGYVSFEQGACEGEKKYGFAGGEGGLYSLGLLRNLQMRSIKILTFFLALCLSFWAVPLFALTGIDSNPQDEYCSIIGYSSEVPSSDKETYVKKSGKFIRYNPSEHQNEKAFYIKSSSSAYEFEDANWVSQGRACKLEKQAYFLMGITFVISFLISFIFLFLFLLIVYSAFQSFKKTPGVR